jgi:putative nucleotidyltransferase with HDIG domain
MTLPGSKTRPPPHLAPEHLVELRRQLVQRIDADDLDLPVLPDVASRVLAACQDPERGPQGLSELIQRDPALAGNVMRIANSAAYAAAEPLVSLQQAIARLGMSTMGDIAIAAAINSKVFVVPGYESEMQSLRLHAATAAIWTREIARQRRRNVEAAFLSGLMHDVGKPILLQAVLELAKDQLVDEETLRAWIDEFHAPVGARLLERWKLPPWVAAAVLGHHEPERAGEHRELAATALLGDLLAHWSVEADENAATARETVLRGHQVLVALCIYPDDLELLMERKVAVQDSARSFA